MNRKCLPCLAVISVVGFAAAISSIAVAQPADPAKETKPAQPIKETKPAQPAKPAAAQPDKKMGEKPQLPPGMTEEDMKDMQTCMEAGKPGPMHAYLAENVGVWTGQCSMWMKPGTEPMKNECTATYTSIMDGRFIKCDVAGSMGEMGPFNGVGIYAYDNVAQKFQSTWIDSCGTGIMYGTGDRSSDGKTLTWTFTYNCPLTKKLTTMREVETRTGKDAMKLEMFGPDKTGKEYKMMEITYTRKASASAESAK
jgi:hypothetical protein